MIEGYVTVHAVGVREKSYCIEPIILVLALVAETPKCACVFTCTSTCTYTLNLAGHSYGCAADPEKSVQRENSSE